MNFLFQVQPPFWEAEYYLIVGVTSIIALVLSFISSIRLCLLNKERFSLLYDYSFIEKEEVAINGRDYRRIAIFKFVFSNQSQIPLSFLSLRLIIGDTVCEMLPDEYVLADFGRKKGNEIVYQEFRKTFATPINLAAFSSCSCYIAFMIPTEIVPHFHKEMQNAIIEITTNRGHTVQTALIEKEFFEFKSCWIKDVWDKVSRKIYMLTKGKASSEC